MYPKHGLKDISELLSRSNAINGTSYLLDCNLKVYAFKEFNINEKECINIIKKEIKTNQVKNKSKCSKKNNGKMEMCCCDEEIDILERFNSKDLGSDECSEEYIDIENDHSGQLYLQERESSSDEIETESSFLLCQNQTVDDEDIPYLMDKLNALNFEPK